MYFFGFNLTNLNDFFCFYNSTVSSFGHEHIEVLACSMENTVAHFLFVTVISTQDTLAGINEKYSRLLSRL